MTFSQPAMASSRFPASSAARGASCSGGVGATVSSAATAMRAVIAHLGGGLEHLRDDGKHLFLAGAALEQRNGAPADERDDRGHTLDLECLGDRGSLVDVDLDQLELARLLARDLLEHGQCRLGLERPRTTT